MDRPPARDWRDWFIMATVTSGVGYGIYVVAKVCTIVPEMPRLAKFSALYNAPNIASDTTAIGAG